MASLRLGPLLRFTDESSATIWVETDARCTVTVLEHSADTFQVGSHHYALVHIDGLEPDSETEYTVELDGERCWPEPDSKFPPSVIATTRRDGKGDVLFGSCRVGFPHDKPYVLAKDKHEDGREYDALYAKALQFAELKHAERPQLLILLGDQVYADDVSPKAREFISNRRDTSEPPGKEVADFEEYTHLYAESWGDETMRWLFSTISSSMIWDDHDVNDDWNISDTWLEDVRESSWWQDRVEGGYVSYWIYQHAGNLSRDELEQDPVWKLVSETEGDCWPALQAWARDAERTPGGTRWSFCRDLGNTRIVIMDSRAGRVLDPEKRSMFDDDEWDWIVDRTEGSFDHLLLGTTIPYLLAPGLQFFEAWNEKLAGGDGVVARYSEKLRRALDMEHWGAFQRSFKLLTDLLRKRASGEDAAESIVVLSGDVHHAYLTEVDFNSGSSVKSSVYQAVCSPFRNPLNRRERTMMKVAHSRPAERIAHWLARRAGVEEPGIGWDFVEGPYFDNQVATLTFDGRDASMRLEKTLRHDAESNGEPQLEQVFQHSLS